MKTQNVIILICMLLGCNELHSQQTIFFAGREWVVKEKLTPKGPGPNYFSTGNVYFDTDGTTLVLQLSKNSQGYWTCAELYSVEHTSYGEHKYYISGRPDLNHPYMVFGTFLYQDIYGDPNNYNVREIDIEFSKFGDVSSSNNGGFAMHRNESGPFWEHKFIANLDNTDDQTTTYYNWTSNSVVFRAHKGIDGDLISGATYTPDSNSSSYFPYETDYLNMHINYWLFGGYTNSDLVSTAPVIKITNVLYPPVHYDANYNFDKDKTIKLREAICNSTINSGRNIAFEISQSIELGPGFEVKAGGTLSINASNNPQMVKRNHNPIGNKTIEPIVPEPPQENAVLYQNYPNPFSSSTTIPLYIPEDVNSARLVLSDLFGRQIKSVEIGNRGNISVHFQDSSLSNGLYYYSLYVDNKLCSSNKMILNK